MWHVGWHVIENFMGNWVSLMDKMESCVMIFLPRKTAKRIHEIFTIDKDVWPLYDTVRNWNSGFETGRSSVDDEPRRGRLPIANDASNIAIVDTTSEMTDHWGNCGWVETKLLDHIKDFAWPALHIKGFTLWVSHFLMPLQQEYLAKASAMMLGICYADEDDLACRLVTVDECLVHFCSPEIEI